MIQLTIPYYCEPASDKSNVPIENEKFRLIFLLKDHQKKRSQYLLIISAFII
jgi:hypothetical protein